jgi:hypothetical protein
MICEKIHKYFFSHTGFDFQSYLMIYRALGRVEFLFHSQQPFPDTWQCQAMEGLSQKKDRPFGTVSFLKTIKIIQ